MPREVELFPKHAKALLNKPIIEENFYTCRSSTVYRTNSSFTNTQKFNTRYLILPQTITFTGDDEVKLDDDYGVLAAITRIIFFLFVYFVHCLSFDRHSLWEGSGSECHFFIFLYPSFREVIFFSPSFSKVCLTVTS